MGYSFDSTAEINSSLQDEVVVETTFQNDFKTALVQQQVVLTAFMWLKQRRPSPFCKLLLRVVERSSNKQLGDFIAILFRTADSPLTDESTFESYPLVRQARSSQPRQVPHTGKGFPFLFSLIAYLRIQSALLVQMLPMLMASPPPGKSTPFNLGNRASKQVLFLVQAKIGTTCAPDISINLTYEAAMQVQFERPSALPNSSPLGQSLVSDCVQIPMIGVCFGTLTTAHTKQAKSKTFILCKVDYQLNYISTRLNKNYPPSLLSSPAYKVIMANTGKLKVDKVIVSYQIEKFNYPMQISQSQSKRRYNIFKNQLFEAAAFKKVPFHFEFNPTLTCVLDHTTQTITTYDKKRNPIKSRRSSKKIFDKRRSYSEQKNSISSIEQSSRCGSMNGERNRNHSLFTNSKKGKFSSEQDLSSIKENDREEIELKLMKTQTQPQKAEISLSNANKNSEQKQKFYRQQLQKKLQLRQQKQRNSLNYENDIDLNILKPDQFAKMIKEVRLATKCKRQIYPIPKVLTEVPYPQNFYYANRQSSDKEGLIYRI